MTDGGSDVCSDGTVRKVLTESDVQHMLDRLQNNPGELALRRIIPDPKHSDRRHEFVAFDDGWHSGRVTETQRGCILSERYRIRKGLIGVPAEQVDLVAFDRTPFPYWLADLVELSCPNCPDVWRTVNEMLVPQYSGLTCAECGSEVSRHV
jgi:hypothetical protein